MSKGLKFLAALISVAGALALAALIIGLPVMLLWNRMMPPLFGFKEIGFAQAVGLSLLCRLLFKPSK